MTRAYDYWYSFERENYNSDGTMTETYRNRLMAKGKSLFDTFALEAIKIREVEEFEKREQLYLERFGETFSEMTARRSEKLTPGQQRQRQQQALDAGEEISSLPYDIEPDEYYGHYGRF